MTREFQVGDIARVKDGVCSCHSGLAGIVDRADNIDIWVQFETTPRGGAARASFAPPELDSCEQVRPTLKLLQRVRFTAKHLDFHGIEGTVTQFKHDGLLAVVITDDLVAYQFETRSLDPVEPSASAAYSPETVSEPAPLLYPNASIEILHRVAFAAAALVESWNLGITGPKTSMRELRKAIEDLHATNATNAPTEDDQIKSLAVKFASPMVAGGYVPQDSVTFKWDELVKFVKAVR